MSLDVDNTKQEGRPGTSASQDVSDASEVVVGCRKSDLALIQARTVIDLLSQTPSTDPSRTFRIATGSAAGDADKQTPFILLSKQTGGSDVGKSLWTNDLEKELVADKVQLLVHSLKDMPTTLPPRCLLGAVTEREDASDAVIMRTDSGYTSIDQLPPGSVVGSSSSRRKALIRRNWPHLEVVECRGNVDTRLAKLDAPSSQFSCILLATAGLLRLDLGHRITQRLEPSVFPYAVGQGALGVEVGSERQDVLRLVDQINHKPSRWRSLAERAMLRSLQGGCSSPIGVWSSLEPLDEDEQGDGEGSKLRLRATVLNIEGTAEVFAEDLGSVRGDDDAEKLGVSVAQKLLDKGAGSLLATQL